MRLHRFKAPVTLGIIVLVTWEAACLFWDVPEYLLPRPTRIAGALLSDCGDLMGHVGVTFLEALLGLVLATVFALALAVLVAYVRGLDAAVMPFAVALKTTPIVAMAPLLLLWLGTGLAPKVAAAALICFFPTLVNTMKGLLALEKGEEDLFRVYSATPTQVLVKLRVFRAAPYFFAGLKVASSLAVVGAIVGEFVGANSGIGYVILVSSYHLETPRMFAALLLSSLAGVLFYSVIAWADRRIVFWVPSLHEDVRLESPRGRRTA